MSPTTELRIADTHPLRLLCVLTYRRILSPRELYYRSSIYFSILRNSILLTEPFYISLLQNSNCSDRLKNLATYLGEIALLYDGFHRYSFSLLAASTISLAHHLIQNSANIGSSNEKENGYMF